MKPSGKQARRIAAQVEMQRRWQKAAEECPIPRQVFEQLWNFVAERIAEHGHDHTLSFTETWAGAQSVDLTSLFSFLRTHRISDDFTLILEGDPNKLFGPSTTRLAQMPIERKALESLLRWLDEACRANGCDDTHRLTRDWLSANGHPVWLTEMALLAQGGGCDCEVVLNVSPDAIYPA